MEHYELTRENHKVIWEDIGEGRFGDFDPYNDEDAPLLRFSCYELIDGEWEPMEDASYCTLLPVDSPEEWLARASESVLSVIGREGSYKHDLEELSWYGPSDFEET